MYSIFVCFQVEYIFGQVSPVHQPCIELEDSDSSEERETHSIHTLTDSALRDFENAMTSNELDRLLGPKYAGVPAAAANVQQIRQRSSNTAATSQQQQRVGSMPSRKQRSSTHKRHTGASRHDETSRHAVMSRHGSEETEIDSMIDEILKSTPNPSLTTTTGSGTHSGGDVIKRSMTHDEFRESMNQDGGGMSFREVHNRGKPIGGKGRSVEDIIKDRTPEEHRELMNWKDKGDKQKEKEKLEMEKLMNTVKNIGLIVKKNSADDAVKNDESSPVRPVDYLEADHQGLSKPPSGAKHGAVPRVAREPEKSPRFVRRRNTLQKNGQRDVVSYTNGGVVRCTYNVLS